MWLRADLGYRTLTIGPCQAATIARPWGCLIVLYYDHASRNESLSILPQNQLQSTPA